MPLILLVFILVSIIGGSANPVFVKLGTQEIPPLTLTLFRFLGAVIFLFPFWYQKKEILKRKDIYKVLPFTINISLFSIGIQFTSVTMSTVLYALTPIFVAIFAHILIKEKLLKHHVVGLLIAIIGISILFVGSLQKTAISFGTPFGNGILLLAVVFWSLFPVSSRSLSKQYKPLTIVFFSCVVTACCLLILVPFEWTVRPFLLSAVSEKGIISVIGLICISSVLYYLLMQWLIKHTSAFSTSLIQYGSVIAGGFSGALFFGEKPTISLVVGAVFVIGGVFLATTYQQLKKKKTAVLQ